VTSVPTKLNGSFGNLRGMGQRDNDEVNRPEPTRRRPGRPVSLASRRAVLETAADLLEERGYSRFAIDEVARRSGVSKATIYKHWRSGYEVAVEAYGDRVTDAVPVRSTGDAVKDLSDQVVRLARFYRSSSGRVVAQLLAAGVGADDGATLVREKFFASRRNDTLALIEEGKASGQLRPDLDVDLANDLLFGAVVFRLFNGMTPITATQAGSIAEMAMHALAQPRP
jgi:AcrR family transcriptional regulator